MDETYKLKEKNPKELKDFFNLDLTGFQCTGIFKGIREELSSQETQDLFDKFDQKMIEDWEYLKDKIVGYEGL